MMLTQVSGNITLSHSVEHLYDNECRLGMYGVTICYPLSMIKEYLLAGQLAHSDFVEAHGRLVNELVQV